MSRVATAVNCSPMATWIAALYWQLWLKKDMVGKMARGESFGLCPGGFHELALTVRGKERVFVKKKGFIYYALKHGCVSLLRAPEVCVCVSGVDDSRDARAVSLSACEPKLTVALHECSSTPFFFLI